MHRQFYATLIIALTTLVGCSTRQINQTSQVSAVRPNGFATVAFKQLAPISVPVHQQGATLRTVVNDARDLASRGGGLVLATAMNDGNLITATGNIQNTNDPFVEMETVVLLRGNTRIVMPTLLVHQTVAGNIRAFPGDLVVAYPLDQAIDIATRLDSSVKVAMTGETFVIKGDQFQERTLKVVRLKNLESLTDVNQWQKNFMDTNSAPDFRPDQLLPNVIAVTRAFEDGSVAVFLFPFAIKGKASDSFSDATVKKFGDKFVITDGDLVEITRLENIPIVAASLMAPIAPRVTQPSAPATQQCLPHVHGSIRQITGAVVAPIFRIGEFVGLAH
jgi:hypothetical protein